MWQKQKINHRQPRGTMSRMKRVRNLIDKVVLAHACTSGIWIYYGLLVFLVVIQVAGTDA